MNDDAFGPGNTEWECLADATLDIYMTTQNEEEMAAALRIWDDLTRLNLAIPPPWIIAVWVATGAIRGPEHGDLNHPITKV